MAVNWIKGATRNKGALTRRAKATGMTLAEYMATPHRSTTIKREIALARTLKKLARRRKSK